VSRWRWSWWTSTLVGLTLAVPGVQRPAVAAPASTGRVPVLTVGPKTAGPPIPSGFAGFSFPLASLESYAGSDPRVANPVLVQLLRNVTSGAPPVLRLGGDSADRAWWPVPGMRRPPGVRYTLTSTWLRVARSLASAAGARLILGINLMANGPRLARAEAGGMIRGIGRRRIAALELGNEPELYRRFSGPRATRRGQAAPAVLRHFNADFERVAHALPPIALAGPSIGSDRWLADVPGFLQENPRVRIATLHRYPLKLCSPNAGVTTAQLLSRRATDGVARGVAAAVSSARARGVPLRIDELNTVACGGAQGVSDTFASALWLLDTLPALARIGVAGVNVQTRPNSFNELFAVARAGARWVASVKPEYYGLLMFAQAAPPGSHMLVITGTEPRELNVWATRDATGDTRVVLVNNDPARAFDASVRVPDASGPATLTRLQAPALNATDGVNLGDQSFGQVTSTGILGTPQAATVSASAPGMYRVTVPEASAALLDVDSAAPS
jgi:Glycosyl hydrolase family 79 C-terminal beta domain